MKGSLPDSSAPEPSQFEPVSPALFQHRRFWLSLAAYRPLLALGAIWIVLLAIAAVAYSRLIYTDNQSAPVPRSNPPAASAPPGLLPRREVPAPEPNPVAGTPQQVPAWSLAALVGTCALGCWVISRQVQAPPRPRRGSRRPPAPTPPSPEPRTAAPEPSPQRLAPYQPGQPLTLMPNPPGNVAAAAIATPPEGSLEASPEVEVMPEDTPHALDWPEGSLAHSLDVRQRRSLSSLL